MNAGSIPDTLVVEQCMADPDMIARFPDEGARHRACWRQAQNGPEGDDVATMHKYEGPDKTNSTK